MNKILTIGLAVLLIGALVWLAFEQRTSLRDIRSEMKSQRNANQQLSDSLRTVAATLSHNQQQIQSATTATSNSRADWQYWQWLALQTLQPRTITGQKDDIVGRLIASGLLKRARDTLLIEKTVWYDSTTNAAIGLATIKLDTLIRRDSSQVATIAILKTSYRQSEAERLRLEACRKKNWVRRWICRCPP